MLRSDIVRFVILAFAPMNAQVFEDGLGSLRASDGRLRAVLFVVLYACQMSLSTACLVLGRNTIGH